MWTCFLSLFLYSCCAHGRAVIRQAIKLGCWTWPNSIWIEHNRCRRWKWSLELYFRLTTYSLYLSVKHFTIVGTNCREVKKWLGISMAITANRRLRSVEARVFRDDHGVLIWLLVEVVFDEPFFGRGKIWTPNYKSHLCWIFLKLPFCFITSKGPVVTICQLEYCKDKMITSTDL